MTKRQEPEHTNGAPSNLEQRVKEIFCEIVDQSTDGDDCETRLEQACQGNEQLRARVLELLSAYRRADQILNLPPVPNMPGSNSEQVGTCDLESQSETDRREDIFLALCGSQIGPYKVLERLGEGGMGIVYLAQQHQPLRRKVALKVVKPGMDSRQILARFDVERQALALMDHPHIAKVLDAGVTDSGRPYFAMEYVKGLPITKYCDQARLTIEERLRLFAQVCQAVQHAHQKGIIHRDLKPSNILICQYDGKSVPKVIDFGLAKALHQPLTELSLHTAHGLMVGTPRYMSPEQAEFNNLDVDTRSDIYSLGVVLYELLTGTTPLEKEQFQNAVVKEMLRLIKEVDPPKPSTRISSSENRVSIAQQRRIDVKQLSRHVQGELDWIVMKALDKERHRRYETAQALARDIERYLVNEPVEACPPTWQYRMTKFVRRNREGVVAAIVIALLLIGGIAGTSFGFWQAAQTNKEILIEKEKTNLALLSESTQRGIAEESEQLAILRQQEAEKQTQLAKTFSELLRYDILGLASVDEQYKVDGSSLGKDVTIRQLLDRAADKTNSRNDMHPIVAAEMHWTIGTTYRKLGETKLAIPHLEASVKFFRSELGDLHYDTLNAMNSLAVAYHLNGDYEQAIHWIELAQRTGQITLDPDDEFRLNLISNLADIYQSAGRSDEAASLLEVTLTSEGPQWPTDHPSILYLRRTLGAILIPTDRLEEAREILQEVYDSFCRTLDEHHPLTLRTLFSLAECNRLSGRIPTAIKQFKTVLENDRERLGETHPETIETMHKLGLAYLANGQIEKATELLEQVRDAWIKQCEPTDPKLSSILNSLAGVYFDSGDYKAAVNAWEELNESYSKIAAGDDFMKATILSNLGTAYHKLKMFDKSIDYLERSSLGYEKLLGIEHADTVLTRFNLAAAYLDVERREDALTIFKEISPRLEQILGADHPAMALVKTALLFKSPEKK